MSASLDLPSGLVTFLFTDIEGSTRLAQLLGPDYRPVLAEHRQILLRALGAGNGVALFTEGDSVFAAFPDATAALQACAEAQRALADARLAPPRRPAAGTDGPAFRVRRAGRQRVRHAGGAPGRPRGRRRPRRAGPLLRGHRAARRRPARGRVAARPRPVPAARLRRPRAALPARGRRAGARLPPPAHGRRHRAQPAGAGGQLRGARQRAGRAARAGRPAPARHRRRAGRRGQDPARAGGRRRDGSSGSATECGSSISPR